MLVRKNWLGKCQRKRGADDGLENIGKERLENGQEDIKGQEKGQSCGRSGWKHHGTGTLSLWFHAPLKQI